MYAAALKVTKHQGESSFNKIFLKCKCEKKQVRQAFDR